MRSSAGSRSTRRRSPPGDTLRYTITIQNTGDQNATNAVLNDTIDNNTVFVPGSLQTTPIARNDSYSTVGNVQLTPVGSSVLQNDSDPDGSGGLSVTAHNPISLNGGTVSMSVNGSFDRDSAGAPLRHIEYTP